jgi:hypothetical protein
VIHESLEVAVHGHAGSLAVSVTEDVSPAAGAIAPVDPSRNVHPVDCMIENVCPPATMLPVRAGPVFAATVNATLPDPVPLGVTPVIHASPVLAVHAHEGSLAVNVTEDDSPAAGTGVPGAPSMNVHPPDCMIENV